MSTALHSPRIDEDESTELDATAASEIALGETQSLNAWSEADDLLEPQRRSWKLPVTLAILAAAVAATSLFMAWPHPTAPNIQQPPASVAAQPPQPLTADDQFIADLASHWGPIPDRPQTIHDGLSVCSLLARGANKTTIEQDLVNKKILTTPDAEFFVNTAAAHYCPQG